MIGNAGPNLRRQPLIMLLLTLELDPDDFVIFGSAPLLVYGLRDAVTDLDIVARGRAWKRAQALAEHQYERSPHSSQPRLRLFDGRIEVYPQWIDDRWSVDELIDEVNKVCGLRFAPLRRVLAYKRQLDRGKDQRDIMVMERHLFGDHPSLPLNLIASAPLIAVR